MNEMRIDMKKSILLVKKIELCIITSLTPVLACAPSLNLAPADRITLVNESAHFALAVSKIPDQPECRDDRRPASLFALRMGACQLDPAKKPINGSENIVCFEELPKLFESIKSDTCRKKFLSEGLDKSLLNLAVQQFDENFQQAFNNPEGKTNLEKAGFATHVAWINSSILGK